MDITEHPLKNTFPYIPSEAMPTHMVTVHSCSWAYLRGLKGIQSIQLLRLAWLGA